MPDDPKLNHQKVLQLIKSAIQPILNSYEEPEAILVGVAWRPEMGEQLPFGMLVVKNDVGMDMLIRCLKQSTKMSENIVQNLRKLANELEKRHASSVRSPSKESHNGQEAAPPVDSGPFAPGTK